MDRSSDKFAATGFLFLNPKNTGFFELFRVYIFGTTKLHKANFVECHEVLEEESFDQYKYLFLLSILLQKLLHLFAYPLKYLGFIVELFLNLASGNYNIFKIILNFLQGCYLIHYFLHVDVYID